MIRENAIKAVFESALKLKEDESCLIVTDTVKEEIGHVFYEYAKKLTPHSEILIVEPTKEHGTEPPENIAQTMLSYKVQLLITEKSLTHTRARINACKKGARIATMPSITEDIANRCLDVDYDSLKAESVRIYNIFKGTSNFKIRTVSGTNLTFDAGQGQFFGEHGGVLDYPGACGNLPEGEISFAPTSCDGVFVVDASFPELGVLSSPITFKVCDNVVYEITGERAGEITDRLDRVGPKAYRIAEFGIGLNPKAKISGNILEDEKVIGTIHIAVGNDLSYGGSNDVPLHLDGVIMSPDILIDEKILMKNGRFI